MITQNEMWRKFKNMKQEILNLKQIKKASCASIYYEYTLELRNSDWHYNWQIFYKQGAQPIITEIVSDAFNVLSSPANDSQYLYIYVQYETELKIFSTREIDRIVGL